MLPAGAEAEGDGMRRPVRRLLGIAAALAIQAAALGLLLLDGTARRPVAAGPVAVLVRLAPARPPADRRLAPASALTLPAPRPLVATPVLPPVAAPAAPSMPAVTPGCRPPGSLPGPIDLPECPLVLNLPGGFHLDAAGRPVPNKDRLPWEIEGPAEIEQAHRTALARLARLFGPPPSKPPPAGQRDRLPIVPITPMQQVEQFTNEFVGEKAPAIGAMEDAIEP